MNVNPNVVKQLLQLHFQSNLRLFSPDSNITAASAEFSQWLETLVGHGVRINEIGINEPQPVSSSPGQALAKLGAWRQTGSNSYDPIIQEAGRNYGVDLGLIKAVIHAESSFNPYAVSRAGAKGLMQLMDSTGKALGVKDPYDPEQNIYGGTKYLADLLRKYKGNVGVALAAYNAGPGRIDSLGIHDDAELWRQYSLLPEETQRYVRKVLDLKQKYAV